MATDQDAQGSENLGAGRSLVRVSRYTDLPDCGPNMRDVTLTIVFSFDPVTNLFNGRLENGAEFQFHGMHVQGKLGANLELFADGVRRISSPKLEPRPPLPTANPYREEDITVLPPGAARGTGREREARQAARAKAKKDLAGLKIEI